MRGSAAARMPRAPTRHSTVSANRPRRRSEHVNRMRRWSILFWLGLAPLFSAPADTLSVDAQAHGQPFPHFWEKCFGSGRAVLSLREDYRHDLDEVRKITGFQYVRFHAILHDENGVYSENAQGEPFYNFNQVDLIYDGLLARGIK